MAMRKKHRAGSLEAPDFNGRPMTVGEPGSSPWFRDLQNRMWSYAQTEGLARFSAAFVADAGSRCELVAERYVPGVGWSSDFDAPNTKQWASQAEIINMLISRFRGKYTAQGRTMWSMLWNKRTAGEVYIAQEESELFGMTYTPYSFKTCVPFKSPDGTPGYNLFDRPELDSARWVRKETVLRFWNPHPDYPAMPYSPLWSGLKDLDRYRLLGKVMDRAANSALLARGVMWFPAEAMDESIVGADGKPHPKLLRDYYASAQQTIDAPDHDYRAIAPFAMYWDSDLGAPEHIEFKWPFGDEWMNARTAAITDFARAVDLPSVIVINGGAGGGGGQDGGGSNNHWSDLLVDRRTFDMTVGSDLDELCNEDLTRYFLWPQLTAKSGDTTGAWPQMNEVKMWRIGADPTKLIVNQDRSLQAMDAYRFGLINLRAALKRLGFRNDEQAGPDDWKRLAELITRSAQSQDMTRFRQRALTSNGGDGSQVQLPNGATGSLRTAIEGLDESGEVILWLADD